MGLGACLTLSAPPPPCNGAAVGGGKVFSFSLFAWEDEFVDPG